MKICVIKDESNNNLEIGYLFYYENSDVFIIELSDKIQDIDVPLFFYPFFRRGIYTLNPEWSLRWVRQRIVPSDRQNLGSILKKNGLKEYNEFKLLILADGRCAQDDCAVFPYNKNSLPEWVSERMNNKLELAVALDDYKLFLVYANQKTCFVDTKALIAKKKELKILLAKPQIFKDAHLLPGGNGVIWSEGVFLMTEELRQTGITLPFSKNEFINILKSSILDTSDVCDELKCSRQYVSKLVQNNELTYLKESGNSRMYYRSEVDKFKQ